MDLLATLVDLVLVPLSYLWSPTRRVYLPFMLIAAALAWWVYRRDSKRRPDLKRPGLFAWMLNPRVWWHPSARLDYKVFLLDSLLRALVLPGGRISTATVAAAVSVTLRLSFGPTEATSEGGERLWIAICFTLAMFLMGDLTRYLLHLWLHRSPFLWEIHKVHHSAEVLTPMTIYRNHPVESLLYTLRAALSSGLVTGAFLFTYGTALSGLDVLGINVFGFAFNVLGANLRHSHVWLSFGSRVERWLLSPAQHQIHHSSDVRHANNNLGSVLAIWDRLFGTLYVTTGYEKLRFGLGPDEHNHDRALRSVYLGPLRAAWATRGDHAGGPRGGTTRGDHANTDARLEQPTQRLRHVR